MTPYETELLVNVNASIERIETKLDCHLGSCKQKCAVVDKQLDKLEQKTEENTTFRNRIIGVFILFSFLSPGVYILIEKLIK